MGEPMTALKTKAARRRGRAARATEEPLDPQQAMTARPWDPAPGSPGRRAPETPPEDEGGEGENQAADLVAGGIDEAERERILQAARNAAKRNWGEP